MNCAKTAEPIEMPTNRISIGLETLSLEDGYHLCQSSTCGQSKQFQHELMFSDMHSFWGPSQPGMLFPMKSKIVADSFNLFKRQLRHLSFVDHNIQCTVCILQYVNFFLHLHLHLNHAPLTATCADHHDHASSAMALRRTLLCLYLSRSRSRSLPYPCSTVEHYLNYLKSKQWESSCRNVM